MTTASMSPLPVEQNTTDVRCCAGTMNISEPSASSPVGRGAVVGNDLGVCDRILADLIYIYIVSLMSKFY